MNHLFLQRIAPTASLKVDSELKTVKSHDLHIESSCVSQWEVMPLVDVLSFYATRQFNYLLCGLNCLFRVHPRPFYE